MKNLARLMIFFSLCFVIFFFFFTLFRFLGFWIDSVRLISIDSGQGGFLIPAVRAALPAALFFTILFTLSYSVRRKISALLSIFFIIILSASFTLGFFLAIDRIQTLDRSLEIPIFSRKPNTRTGLILSRQDMAVVFLNEDRLDYPRVISFPERPLMYQEAALGPNYSVPPLPFIDRTPWLIRSILIDFNLTSREFHARFREGLLSFGIYAGSLIFLLVSLRFILTLCSWPLANLFLGALVFRFVLSLEIFLNTPEPLAFLNAFLGNRFPEALIAPMVFCALGSLILVYTFLAFLVRRNTKRREDD